MGQSYIGSTVRMGSETLTDTVDGGFAVLTQTATVTTNSGTAVSATIRVPAGSQILQILADKTTLQVVGGGTATAIAVTVGNVAAGTQYMPSTDLVTVARAVPTYTLAQLAAQADVGTNTSVVMTVAPNGTILTTQGVFRLTLVYAQKL